MSRSSMSPDEIPYHPHFPSPPSFSHSVSYSSHTSTATTANTLKSTRRLTRSSTATSTGDLGSLGGGSICERPMRMGLVGEEEDEDEESAWEKEERWFSVVAGRGTIGRQRYHPFPASEVPYWMSYSQGAMNWDALMNAALFTAMNHGAAAFLPSLSKTTGELVAGASPPKRVLDIGCGLGAVWCIDMARHPGWEQTQFVGLDVVPCVVPVAQLPYETSNRISCVQHNFLLGLPFEDNKFDYVRIAYVSLGVPGEQRAAIWPACALTFTLRPPAEHKWADLIEEATRVLAPGCLLEILESDFAVHRKRQTPVDPLTRRQSSVSLPISIDDSSDPFSLVDDSFDAVLEKRFINSHALGIIPSALALECQNVQSSGSLFIDLPSSPPASEQSPPPISTLLETSPFQSYSAGTEAGTLPTSTESPRVYLHAYAERMASTSQGIAHDAAARTTRRGIAADPHFVPRQEKLQQELNDLVVDWCEDLKVRAGLPQVLANRWAWHCEMDEKTQVALSDNIPIFVERLVGYERLHNASSEYEMDPEIEFRKAQIQFARREAEVDLREVQRRLGAREFADEGAIGSLETAAFVARAP